MKNKLNNIVFFQNMPNIKITQGGLAQKDKLKNALDKAC
jgi:hypothetical protein